MQLPAENTDDICPDLHLTAQASRELLEAVDGESILSAVKITEGGFAQLQEAITASLSKVLALPISLSLRFQRGIAAILLFQGT